VNRTAIKYRGIAIGVGVVAAVLVGCTLSLRAIPKRFAIHARMPVALFARLPDPILARTYAVDLKTKGDSPVAAPAYMLARLPGGGGDPDVAEGSGFPMHRIPTGKDSFLLYKVYSVEQLLLEVEQEPIVRKRFARHFRISEGRVLSYMRNNLVESYIPKSGFYTVYNCRKDGSFYTTKQFFRVGTKVFALRNGQPVMKWVCGNPLAKALPAVRKLAQQQTVPVIKIGGSIETTTPTDTFDVSVPNEIAEYVIQPNVPLGPHIASLPPVITVGSAWSPGNWLWLIPPALILGQSGGDHGPVSGVGTVGSTIGSTTGTTTNTTTGNTTTTSTSGASGTTGNTTTTNNTTTTTTGNTSGTSTTSTSTTGPTTTTSTTGPTTTTTSTTGPTTTTSTTGPTTTTTSTTGPTTTTTTNTTGPTTTNSTTTNSSSSSTTTNTTVITIGSTNTTTTSTGTEVPEPGQWSYLIAIVLAVLVVGRRGIMRFHINRRYGGR
jgi:hypothetical protein